MIKNWIYKLSPHNNIDLLFEKETISKSIKDVLQPNENISKN